MARANHESGSLRFSRRESGRLVVALLLSLFAHLGLWGGYAAGKKLGWWEASRPALHLPPTAKNNPPPVPPPPPLVQDDEPNVFVDVSHADADAPKQPKYYSNNNSRAANPDTANSTVPKINGTQKDVPKTEDVPRLVSQPQTPTKAETVRSLPPLQPSLPPPPLARAEPAEAPQTPGDLDPKKPKRSTPPPTPAPKPPPERPRTIKDALAQRDQLPGQQMQQAGGVPRPAFTSSLDAKATPFGDYDAAIIKAVSQRWNDLLDSRRFALDRTGKVILRFELKSDGSIIEMQTLENSVGDLLAYLCQEAIEEAAPFAKWPPDMARLIGSNYRDVSFTFYYY